MDTGRSSGRRNAGRDQQRGGRDAVRHPQRAVDQLRDEPDKSEHQKLLHANLPEGLAIKLTYKVVNTCRGD
jgi:hypothetical protein